MVSFPLKTLARELSATVIGAEVSAATAVVFDTRKVVPGAVFVAIPGAKADGHHFVSEAFEHGAVAAVVEREEALRGRAGLVVQDSLRALSRLAAI